MPRKFNTTQPLGRTLAARGLSVEDLSRATAISSRTISDYLAGRRPIQPHHGPLLADALQVEVLDLMGDADEAAVATNTGPDTSANTPRHNLYA